MGDFDDIEKADVGGRLPNIEPGRYTFEVLGLKMINSRTKGRMFIAEFAVAERHTPTGNEPGSKASWIVKMSTDNAKGNIKGFVAALLNEKDTKVTAEMCEELVAPEQIAKGNKVLADAHVIKTKAGNDFTLVQYSPVPAPPAASGKSGKK